MLHSAVGRRMDRLWLVLEVEWWGEGGEFRVVRRSIIDWSVLQPGQRMHHNRLHMLRGGLRFVTAFRGRVYFLPFHRGVRHSIGRKRARTWRCGAACVRSAVVMTTYRVVQRNVGR